MIIIPRGISLRLFFGILIIMVLLSWQFINSSSEHIKTGTQQAVEVTLVDTANLLAAVVEQQSKRSGKLDTSLLAAQIEKAQQRQLSAQIYSHLKQHLEISVYVTDTDGMVVYDSQGKAVGQDYSRWNDVYLALLGRYGARVSYIDANRSEDGDPKQMVIGLPIEVDDKIIGMLAVSQPDSVHDVLRLQNWGSLRWLVIGYLGLALAVLLLMAWWLARSLNRITEYAEDMASNRPTKQPKFSDVYLRRLAESLRHLRHELNGKQTVEHYVHALTHELKTPLTSIHATAEFLNEVDLSNDEREHFAGQISRASERMQVLIDRLLKLARLENREQIEQPLPVSLAEVTYQVTKDLPPSAEDKKLKVNTDDVEAVYVHGDRILIEQALSNLIDNAIGFAAPESSITLSTEVLENFIAISVHNRGMAIPAYALPKLTERFFSLPRPDGTPRSSGLGLSFTAQIMALHDGELRIHNTANGVCATLVFPM